MKYILALSLILSSSVSFGADRPKPIRKALIIFSAAWCGPCNQAKKDMNSNPQLTKLLEDYEVLKIDFDADKEIVNSYNVSSVPTFVVVDKDRGEEIKRQKGYKTTAELVSFLK